MFQTCPKPSPQKNKQRNFRKVKRKICSLYSCRRSAFRREYSDKLIILMSRVSVNLQPEGKHAKNIPQILWAINCLRAQLHKFPRLMRNYQGKWNIKHYFDDKNLSVKSSAMVRYKITDVLKDFTAFVFKVKSKAFFARLNIPGRTSYLARNNHYCIIFGMIYKLTRSFQSKAKECFLWAPLGPTVRLYQRLHQRKKNYWASKFENFTESCLAVQIFKSP